MRTSALALAAPLTGRFRPLITVENDNQPGSCLGLLEDGPFMAAVVEPASGPAWPTFPSIWDWIMKMATHMTYGGAGITTNRLNGGGTAPLNGGWGLNTATLTTAISDTALFDPAPEARVAGAYTQQTTAANVPNDTAQVIVTIQASAPRAILEFGLFDATTAAPQTTTSATVSSTSATTIAVASTAGFSNATYAQLDSEVISITSSSAGTLTVGRGARGSTAATHISGATVTGGEGNSNMFMKGDFAVINLNNGDSIAFTAKMQYIPS